MRSKKVRAAMIAAAACLSFTSVVAPSATALAAVIPDLRRRQTETGIITTTDRK